MTQITYSGRFDATLSKVQWTAWGAARIPARFARVGVLDYPDGREHKPEEELFEPSSMATLKGAPVIDIVDHTELVRPEDAQRKTLGFVEEVHREGDYLAGTIIVHDGPTIEAIKRGERLDLSAGYLAPTDRSPGTYRGERYDRVQRDIIYNHVALCPPGRGRAGREVGLRLDRSTHPRFDALAWRSALARVSDRTRMFELSTGRLDAIRSRRSAPARLMGGFGVVDDEERSVRVLASTPNDVDGEALASWDLDRFSKNPVILWGHDADALPIGVADEIESTPEGLSMRVRFASARANPLAEQVLAGVREGIIRGVSVGFVPGAAREEERDGRRVTVRSANELLEVSFVAIPADEDALAGPTTDRERSRRTPVGIGVDDDERNQRSDGRKGRTNMSDDFKAGYDSMTGYLEGRHGVSRRSDAEHPVAKARRANHERMLGLSGAAPTTTTMHADASVHPVTAARARDRERSRSDGRR